MDQKTEDARTFLLDTMQTATHAKHDYDSFRVGMLRAEDEARKEEAREKTLRTAKIMAFTFLLAFASLIAVASF